MLASVLGIVEVQSMSGQRGWGGRCLGDGPGVEVRLHSLENPQAGDRGVGDGQMLLKKGGRRRWVGWY